MESLEVYVAPFFAWLWKATLQGSVLVCLIVLIKLLLQRRLPARWNYALWFVLLVRLSLPWAPQSRLSLYNLFPRQGAEGYQLRGAALQQTSEATITAPEGLARIDPYAEQADESAPDILPAPTRVPLSVPASERVTVPSTAGTTLPTVRRPSTAEERPASIHKITDLLPLLWLSGFVLLGGYVLIRNLRFRSAVIRERPVTDQQVLELLEDAKMQTGIQTIVGVIVTDKIRSPALFGFIRPRLLLPEGLLEALSLDELHHVFLHELAHLKRRDIYVGWWAAVLQILHWFNPLIWLAFRWMRADQEMACDALVLSRMTQEEPPVYGRTIINLLERFSQLQYLPSVAGILEDKSRLERRIAMITRFKHSSTRWSPLAAFLVVAVGCTALSDARKTAPAHAAIVPSKPTVTLRKMQLEHGDFANTSPDGRYLCDEDWETGNLMIRELSTGRRWSVTGKTSWDDSDDYTLWAAISPDSRKVAYLWYDSTRDSSDLYVAALDGTDRRLLCADKHLAPKDWSADGARILAALYEDSRRQLVWVDAQDGSTEPVRDLDGTEPGKFDVSPDGRFLAFDLPQAENTSKRDIFLLDLRRNHEIRLAAHEADDRMLGWTPNGQWILFASDRSDSWDAYLLGVRNGTPVGHPKLVKTSIGDVGAAGFGSDGDYYFSVYDLRRNVYTARFDPGKGLLLTPPEPVGATDKSTMPVWSPDGRYLAYARLGDPGSGWLRIRTVASGQEREIDLKPLHFPYFRWAPDSHSLLLSGYREDDWKGVICTLDLQTEECSELLRKEGTSIGIAQWFPDGKRLLYPVEGGSKVMSAVGKPLDSLMICDLKTNEEREVAQGTFPLVRDQHWALSPDGRRLAVCIGSNNSTIKVFSTEADEVIEILTGELVEKIPQIVWSADGRTLLLRVVDLSVPAPHNSEIWCVAPEGGEPERISELNVPEYVTAMRIAPAGRYIALEAITNLHELWVMENFLPEEALAQASP